MSAYDSRTLSVHGGLRPDPLTGAIAPNICTSSNFAFQPAGLAFSANENAEMTTKPYIYSRWTNPTVRQLEQRMAALEGSPGMEIDGIALASGMAAISCLFFGVLKSGDHIVISDVCYPGVRELLTEVMADLGVSYSAVNFTDLDAVRAAIKSNTRLVHAETPCNPLLRLTDLAELSAIVKEAGAGAGASPLLSVDSTMATPVATQPLHLGADFVIHSLTKFINGHGDALGGVLLGRKSVLEPIRSRTAVRLGGTLSPQSAWLIMRGIDTLFPRMDAVARHAQRVAEGLEQHPAVLRVIYPGLPSHPQAELARRQMRNFSGMMTFQVRADPEAVAAAMAGEGGTKLVHFAVSLGHQRSNIVLMRTDELMRSTYMLQGEALDDYRRYAGDAVFRLSVGLESPEDVLADLFSVLDRFVA
jgi:cystathionine gamma-synthase